MAEQKLKFKRGLKAILEAKLVGTNKPLKGEPVFETDTNKLKIGDGVKDYKDLPYIAGDVSYTGGDGIQITEGTISVDNTVARTSELQAEATTRATADADLDTRLRNVEGRGRFLSAWDCTTGKPTTEPTTGLPYTYKSGDYYLVSKVATNKNNANNYKPDGTQYTGAASTKIETEQVLVGNQYTFDGTNWTLIGSTKDVAWGQIIGDINDQEDLVAEFAKKQDVIDSTHKLYSDLVDTTGQSNLFVNSDEKQEIAKVANKADKTYVDEQLANKQDNLTAGANIQINGNTISATDTTYSAGTGITIGTDNKINVNNYDNLADKTYVQGQVNIEKERAQGIEAGLRTDVDAKADKTYVDTELAKKASTDALQAEVSRATGAETTLGGRITTIEGKEAGWDAKSKVSVSATGSATEEVQYITIDGVEKKLAGGGSGEPAEYIKSATISGNKLTLTKKDGTTVVYEPDLSDYATQAALNSEAEARALADSQLQGQIDTKSTVSASASGSSTTEAKYITIDGTEWKLPEGGSGSSATVTQKECENGADHSAILATITNPKQGDIAIIKEAIDPEATKRQYTAYVYTGSAWAAMDGNYNAENVYFAKDIIYTKAIGELPAVPSTGSATLQAKGKNVKQIFDTILAQRKQPEVTNPVLSISGQATNIDLEIGTSVNKSGTLTGSLSAGSYTYGPATGVTAQSWSQEVKYTAGKSGSIATGTTSSLVYNYSFQLGRDGDTVAVNFASTATHNEGAIAKDNLGDDSNPVKRVVAGSKSNNATATYTSYRKMFYGTRTDKTDLDSAKIRALASSEKQAAKIVTVNIPVGAFRTIIAVPSNRTVTSVIDVNGMSAEILDSFTQISVNVEGAEGYTAIEYKVYYLDYAEAIAKANTYKVTIA